MKIAFAIVMFLVVSCARKDESEVPKLKLLMAPPAINASYYEHSEPESSSDEYSGDRIIKTANLRFQVDSVESSTESIETIVTNCRGTIADQNISNATNEVGSSFVIRVPAASFERTIGELCKLALFVNYKRITSQNVTEEVQDVQTRLKTKKEVRDRYNEILKTKAKSVEDIMKAEEHIRLLQEEIESREGRLRFLQSRTAMSEINMEIYQKVTFIESPTLVEKRFSKRVTDAIATGWSLVTTFVLLVISSWPVLLVSTLMVIIWRRFKRRIAIRA